jgi:hypothetical protein
MKPKNADKLKALQNEVRVLKASQLFVLTDAYRKIDKCGQDRYMGSGITLTIKNINKDNNVIVEEVIITDGLSPETIAAIKADLKRSYETMSYPHNKI